MIYLFTGNMGTGKTSRVVWGTVSFCTRNK
ncbi:zonular occludens toxin domain-containing protein [Neisseria sp. P0001.S009]